MSGQLGRAGPPGFGARSGALARFMLIGECDSIMSDGLRAMGPGRRRRWLSIGKIVVKQAINPVDEMDVES